MIKGASIKFQSYGTTVPKILDLMKIERELKKFDKIVLKPHLSTDAENSTPAEFVESVLQFCIQHKNPVAEVFIAEGADGEDTRELFDSLGYKSLAEKYSIGLLDLNESETETIEDEDFLKFSEIHYPKILKESLVISLPKLHADEEAEVFGALANMIGAFPAEYYSGFFSSKKSKIRKWPMKYSIHDIAQCRMPHFALVDATQYGVILAGLPLEIDKQGAKLLGKDWKEVGHLRLIDKSLTQEEPEKEVEKEQ